MRDPAAFGPTTTTEEVLAGIDLAGRIVLVTGGSSGLGKETARALAAHGAEVILTARDVPKGEAVAAETGKGREEQLGPHAVFVHRADALVDVVGGRDHVVVMACEEVIALALFSLAEAARVRVALEPERVEATLPLPTLHAGLGFDYSRRSRLHHFGW